MGEGCTPRGTVRRHSLQNSDLVTVRVNQELVAQNLDKATLADIDLIMKQC